MRSFDNARSGTLEAKVDLLLDREEISDVIKRYAQSIDTRNFELLRTCYTEKIDMDFRATVPGLNRTGLDVDEWIQMVSRFHSQFDGTEHVLIPEGIDIDGDEARCYVIMHASHFKRGAVGDPHHLIVGSYDVGLKRTSDGWRMHRVGQTVRWVEGNWDSHLSATKAVMEGSQD